MFGGIFVEDGIGVVDVDEDLACGGVSRELGEESVASGEGDVAHFPGGLVAAARAEEFVVGPEGAVEERDAAGSGGLAPFAGDIGKRGGEEERFGALFETERDDGFWRRQRTAELGADVVGEAATYRNRGADESRRGRRIFAEAAGKASAGRERLPVDRWFGAVKDIEDAVFGLHDFLNGGSGEEEEGLEFTQMEQSHKGIDVGGREKDAADRSAGGFAGGRSQLSGSEYLCAEIGRGAEEEPDYTVGREGELRLRAGGGLARAGAQAGAVAAGAVPLREATAGGRTEDFDLHRRGR